MRHTKLVVILALVGVSLSAPVVLFFARSPVLIVTDAPFAALYGASHLQQQQISASLTLFRPVKPVMVADGVSADMVSLAVAEASAQPFCVLFARSQAAAARHYHERFPEIPAVLLRGLATVPELSPPDGFLCVYGTDRETDLYRAGLFAGILGGTKPAENPEESNVRTYVMRQDRSVQASGRELFSQGVKEQDPEAVVIFANTTAQIPDMKVISSIVLLGVGGDFLEKNPQMPIILFSWLDPTLSAQEVAVQFDDSAWALAIPAVRMAVAGEAEGKIPSKPRFFSHKIANDNIFRLLKKSAKKTP
jgi:hypothetical protein